MSLPFESARNRELRISARCHLLHLLYTSFVRTNFPHPFSAKFRFAHMRHAPSALVVCCRCTYFCSTSQSSARHVDDPPRAQKAPIALCDHRVTRNAEFRSIGGGAKICQSIIFHFRVHSPSLCECFLPALSCSSLG